MKYATLNPRNLIIRVEDHLPAAQPQNVMNHLSVVEISDEIAATFDAGRTATPPILYFYEDGGLITFTEKMQLRRMFGPQQLPFSGVDQWIERQGFSALKVLSLMDIEAKLAAENKSSEKLIAVRNWLNGITVSFALNPASNGNWPIAPFRFEETIQEAITVLGTP
jgi:hypothetical protein